MRYHVNLAMKLVTLVAACGASSGCAPGLGVRQREAEQVWIAALSAARQGNWEKVADAKEKILSFGSDALGVVGQSLQSMEGDRRERGLALEVIAAFSTKDALPYLRAGLRNATAREAQIISNGILRLGGDEHAVPHLVQALRGNKSEVWSEFERRFALGVGGVPIKHYDEVEGGAAILYALALSARPGSSELTRLIVDADLELSVLGVFCAWRSVVEYYPERVAQAWLLVPFLIRLLADDRMPNVAITDVGEAPTGAAESERTVVDGREVVVRLLTDVTFNAYIGGGMRDGWARCRRRWEVWFACAEKVPCEERLRAAWHEAQHWTTEQRALVHEGDGSLVLALVLSEAPAPWTVVSILDAASTRKFWGSRLNYHAAEVMERRLTFWTGQYIRWRGRDSRDEMRPDELGRWWSANRSRVCWNPTVGRLEFLPN
jgi:hypothetical protein